MRRTLALAGIVALGVTGLSGPASADPGAGIADHGGIFISEVAVELVNAGPDDDIQGVYVEIINHNTTATPIVGFTVLGCDATNGLVQIAQVPGATPNLAAGDTYLIANDEYADPGGNPREQGFDMTAPDLVQSDGGVQLRNSTTVLDEVSWGSPDDGTCAAFPDASSLLPNDDKSLHQDFANGGWVLRDPTPDDSTIPVS